MSYKLEKPYTDEQRANFVCEHLGLIPVETDDAFYFLEDWEELQNGQVADISNTDDYKSKITAQQNAVKKAKLQAQIQELEQKQFRSAKAKFALSTNENDLTYYNNYETQINDLREQISSL